MAELGSLLTESIKSDASTDLVVAAIDSGLDAAISSGALDGVPIFGTATGLWRAGKEIQQELFIRKIVRFLSQASTTNSVERAKFVDGLKQRGKAEEFGETILLILDRLDDTVKPGLVGRVMAAHMRGEIEYNIALRLASIIARCYATDLNFLKTFRQGTQRENTPIAESLFAAGVLSHGGIDGGRVGDPLSGGVFFELNEYGELLLKHALK